MRSGARSRNSFSRLCDAYLDSEDFKALRSASQDLWRRELVFACRFLGDASLFEVQPPLVIRYLKGLRSRPYKQQAALSALRQVQAWAFGEGRIRFPFMEGVSKKFPKPTSGHTPWTEQQVQLGERVAAPELSRVITLMAWTGQRESDAVRLGWNDIETVGGRDGFALEQLKTRRQIWVPILEPLCKAMQSWERRPGPFLLSPSGRPWQPHYLSDRWRDERGRNPELRPLLEAGLVLHGLRGHACVRLYQAGCDTREVGDMVGMNEPTVRRYTSKWGSRERNLATVIRLEDKGRTSVEEKNNA